MRALKGERAFWLLLLALVTWLLVSCASAADDDDDPTGGDDGNKPYITRQWTGNRIEQMLYFDDSDSMLAVEEPPSSRVWHSKDLGVKWDRVEELGESKVVFILLNPNSKKVAVALTDSEKHWITKDQGATWDQFEIKGRPAFRFPPILSFHSLDENKIIINTINKNGARQAFYTDNGFKNSTRLRKDALHCLWANEQEHFDAKRDAKEGKNEDSKRDTINNHRALCIVYGRYSPSRTEWRLVMSDDYFKSENEPKLENGRPAHGIASIVAEKGFVLAARQASGTNEMALYVTTDTEDWHHADFGDHQLKQGGYTVMQSTNYSLQVDVSVSDHSSAPLGALYTSNSHGYSFVRNEKYFTNRNEHGWVDFEQISGIQGVVLVNIVSNGKQVLDMDTRKKIKSQISYDDGRTWHDLKTKDDENLHLHSVTEQLNVGKVFSSLAPGMAMGLGNTGSELDDSIAHADLYVSDDAGRTWTRHLEGAHLYEFGDQGSVLLAVYFQDTTSKLMYSLNHGADWKELDLKDYFKNKYEIKALSLTTLPDSTSLKFHLTGSYGRGDQTEYHVYTIDFKKMKKRNCQKPDDFEKWPAVVGDNGKPACIMGHKQIFDRRKADADCFIGKKFKDPKAETEDCPCSLDDYECDAGFQRSQDRKTCERSKDFEPPNGECSDGKDTYEDDSGFRKIPGNTCKNEGDFSKDVEKKVKRPCPKKGGKSKSDGKITATITPFNAQEIAEFYYLERGDTSKGDDETVILRTNENKVWVSHDHGKEWSQPEDIGSGDIIAIYPHRYIKEQVYLMTATSNVYYSKNRANSFGLFEAPAPPNNVNIQILRFHPKEENWLIWTACEKVKGKVQGACVPQAHITKKNGAKWDPLLKAVHNCEFTWREDRDEFVSESLIYCMQHHEEDMSKPFKLISSEDSFDTSKEHFNDMINFATMSEYIVVAAKETKNDKLLKVDASVDGKTFADAKFPKNLKVHHSMAYTVLDSSTHSIFLHVTTNPARGQEYGSIIKSNENGTFYVKSLENVNRNTAGYVDFEKMLSLPGAAIANVVDNVDELSKGNSKKLKTVMTHDDGATWDFIPPPKQDAEENPYKCKKKQDLKECSLHLHGYTERWDPRDTFASPSAVGLMFAVGNVGEYLLPKRDGHTFMSTDGGITWKTAKNGEYMWEYGDRGAVLVLVDPVRPTKVVYYSLNMGKSWVEYEFSDEDIVVKDITTVPSDTSRNFLLWGKRMGFDTNPVTVNLDFSGLAKRECNTEEPKPGEKGSDYELWTPKHPSLDKNSKCLFGRITQFLRKRPGVTDCYNPKNFGTATHNVVDQCPCDRVDFECDWNYEPQSLVDQTCKLVEGFKPKDNSKVCKNEGISSYFEPTGYRKVRISDCKGGLDLENRTEVACPGKEAEYLEQKGGMSGAGLFFAIVVPIAAAITFGWWMWRNMDGRFGKIRLGDGSRGTSNGGVRSGSSGDWTKYPVAFVSGVVAVAMAIPMMFALMWRSVRERIPGGRRSFYSNYGRSGYGAYGNGRAYTSRESFSRDGRDYSDGPHNDERDLLGEESDED